MVSPALVWAQPGLPADFVHPVDTIYVIASPVDGGKQTLFKLNSLDLRISVDFLKYNIVVSSPDNGEPFSRYVRVMGVAPGVLPESGSTSPVIDLQMAGCLVLVSKSAPGVNSAPIMKDGLGSRTAMFTLGNWYYCYARFTKLGQVFTCNPDNSYNGDQVFHPAQNAVIIMGPKREVTIQTQFK
jgi:hypothetical protein